MTLEDGLDQAEYLEQLAREVSDLRARVGTFERERLEALLGEPGGARVGSANIPGMSLGASDLNRTLGNVSPYYGQTNLLSDPTLERIESVSPIGTVENAFSSWRAKYVLNSGTAPTTRVWNVGLERFSDYNPYNSVAGELRASGFASGSTTFYVYPYLGYVADADTETLPFLVAACRIGDFGNSLNVLTNVTSISVSLQIIDSAGNVEVESDVHDFKSLVGRRPEQMQLSCAFQAALNDTYTWRLKVTIVASGAGGTVRVKIGEPQLHWAYSVDPAPFAPIVGRHIPNSIYWPRVGTIGDASAIIIGKYEGQTNLDLFQVRGDGRMEWGDGQGGGFDGFLKRSPDGGLQVGDDVSGGIIDRYDGNDVFNTFTPTLVNDGTATYTSEEGWWQRIGKMVFVSAHLKINAAGSGASSVTMALPFTPNRTQSQILVAGGTGLFIAGIASAGVALINDAGAGAVVDQFRMSGDAATNRDAALTGADLLASSQLWVQGWYRAA